MDSIRRQGARHIARTAVSGASRLAAGILLFLALFASAAYADAPLPLPVNSIVQPNGTLPVRDSVPQGVFGFKGNDIGTVDGRTRCMVIGGKVISTLFGNQTWLMLSFGSGKIGWIFTGTDPNPLQNVTVIRLGANRNMLPPVKGRFPER